MNIGISSKLRHFSFRALNIHYLAVFDKYHSRSCQHTHTVDVRQLRLVIISIKMRGKKIWMLDIWSDTFENWNKRQSVLSCEKEWEPKNYEVIHGSGQGMPSGRTLQTLRFSLGFGSYCLGNEYPLKGF